MMREDKFVEFILTRCISCQPPQVKILPLLGPDFQSDDYEKLNIVYRKPVRVLEAETFIQNTRYNLKFYIAIIFFIYFTCKFSGPGSQYLIGHY